MKISQVQHAAVVRAGEPVVSVVNSATLLPLMDRSGTEETKRLRASVAKETKKAAGAREARVQSLTIAVRSGGFHPPAADVAEQLLAQTEFEARLSAYVR